MSQTTSEATAGEARSAALDLTSSCIGLRVCVLRYGLWLAMLVSAYAPFVEAASGKLDWMEESSY